MARHAEHEVRWIEWGTFEIDGEIHSKTERGRTGAGKDIRVIGRKVTSWKERKGHRLTAAMITGVFDHDIDTLVIGNGVSGAIECPAEVVEWIREHGIDDLVIQRTPEACETFNRLRRDGVRAALLAHATC